LYGLQAAIAIAADTTTKKDCLAAVLSIFLVRDYAAALLFAVPDLVKGEIRLVQLGH